MEMKIFKTKNACSAPIPAAEEYRTKQALRLQVD